MKYRTRFALALFAASLSLASAKEVVNAHPASFPAHRAQIEKTLKSDAYSELTRTERLSVIAALDRMETTLAGIDSIQSLSESKKTQLINDQEFVNTVLTQGKEDSRLICRHETKTGSHRRTSKCQTVAERRRELESSQDALRDHQRIKVPCREAPGCNGANGNPIL